ncbi:S-crystallin 3-like [Argonauta hians]
MPSYTLHYFNQRGRVEICRMLLAAGSIKYNDHRIESTDWNNLRNRMPCSMLPVLEIDSRIQIPQSMTIARYLARELGFNGKSNIDMARVDFISQCFYDIIDDYLRMYQDKEGKIKFERKQDVSCSSECRMKFRETCQRLLPYLEKTLEQHNNGNQYFMGDQLTMADMMCYCALENPLIEDPSFLSRYPKLQSLRNRIQNHPKLSSYIKSQQRTEF